MPAKPVIAVKDASAPRMLDLTANEFRRLVVCAALPPPVKIGPFERWRVSDIDAIFSGDAALPSEDFEL